MKKITAFFLALFPLIVIVLLFVSGMIVKDYVHVFVTSVEFDRDQVVKKCPNNTPYPTDDQGKAVTEQLHVNVLPFNATDPTVYYMSSDENIAEVDDNGKVTIHDFGEAEIYVFARENRNISAKCEIKVTDDKIHRIDITNSSEGSYLGYHESVHLNGQPIPYDDLQEGIDPNVYFEEKTTEYFTLTPDGQITAKEEATTQPIKIAYHIEESDKQPLIRQEMEVSVGPGVTSIAFKDPTNSFIKEETYNLYTDICTFPEDVTSGRIHPTDFEYVSSDESVATVDDMGKITFAKAGEAEFNVIYKKNPKLTLKKKISSSCLYAADIAFNRYNFTDSLGNYPDNDPYIDPEDIN